MTLMDGLIAALMIAVAAMNHRAQRRREEAISEAARLLKQQRELLQ